MKQTYWITTSIVALFLLWSAYSYFFSKATIDGVKTLGFPDHFRIELAILKVMATIILLVPQMPAPVKEWAYAGVGLFFITAIVAHLAHKDPIGITIVNLVLLGILVVSNYYFHKLF